VADSRKSASSDRRQSNMANVEGVVDSCKSALSGRRRSHTDGEEGVYAVRMSLAVVR